MFTKKFKVALVILIGLCIVGIPLIVNAQSSSNVSTPQPLVYRFSGWWDGLYYNVLSGNRPDLKKVHPLWVDNPGVWNTSGGGAGTAEFSSTFYTPKIMESALAVAVYVDTTLGAYDNGGGGTYAAGPADTARAYVTLVADGVAKELKTFEANFIRVVLDSTDSPQTPFIDSLDIDTTANTAQIVMGDNGSGTGGLYNGDGEDIWDVVQNSEIVKVNGEQWTRVSNLSSLPSNAKCYTIDYDNGLITFKSITGSDVITVECVLAPDLNSSELDPAVRYGGAITDNYIKNASSGNWPNCDIDSSENFNDFFNGWGRVSDIAVLPWSADHSGDEHLSHHVNIYVLDRQAPDDSSYLFCYSNAKFDSSFSSLSIPYSQRYRGNLNNPTAIAVVSATNSNPGVKFTTTTDIDAANAAAATTHGSNYVVDDSIRIFLTETGKNRVIVINGSIGIDENVDVKSSLLPSTYPDYPEYSKVWVSQTSGHFYGDQKHYLRYRTALGGSRLSFFPDTVTYTLYGDSINQVFFFNRHEESFSVMEWPTVWVDEDGDGTYETSEIWSRVENLTVVGDTGAYELDRFADPDGAFAPGDAFTEKGGGKIMFGNGIHGRIPPAGDTWNVRIAYYPSPDMFVYDNTYADSTSGASGQLSQPTGVAARYNEITGKVDVYIGDRGHQCVKKFVWDENSDWAHKFQYVSKFAEGSDPVSIAVGRYHKGSTVADSSDVYVYIADYSHDKVLVYRDDQALNPALATAPTKFTELGGTGTDLGKFYRPTDVWVVSGERFNNWHGASATGTGAGGVGYYGNKLDLYVADWGDNSSGRVTKIEGITNTAPTITSVTPLTSECDANGYIYLNKQSTYTIQFTATDDELSTCTVDLYYAPNDSATIDSSILIASGITVSSSGKGSYDWTPENTSGITLPDTGYVLAIITDKYNQKDDDYSDCQIVVNNTVPTIKFLSDYNCQGTPGDSIIVVYEGEGNGWAGEDQRSIILYAQNPNKLTFFKVTATFDTSVIKISKIVEGELLSAYGGDLTEFYYSPDVDQINATGKFSIAGGLKFPGSDEGINKSGVLARIMYYVDTTGINTDDPTATADQRVVVSDPGTGIGITIDEANSIMIKAGNDTLEVKAWGNASLYKTLLGDIAGPDYYTNVYLNHKAPNMVPAPDGRIDNDDVMAFVFAWNGTVTDNTGYQDPLSDLAPALSWKSGVRAPYLFARPDCKWEADDVTAFSEMYSWYRSFGAASLAKVAKASTPVDYDKVEAQLPLQFKYLGGSLTAGNEAVFDIYANNVKDLRLIRSILEFDPEEIEVVNVQMLGMLEKDGANTTLFKDAAKGKLDLAAAVFSHVNKGVSGTGSVIRVTLRAKKTISSDIVYSYQIFDDNNILVSEKVTKLGANTLAKLGVPKSFNLKQNYPNPFNPTTEIAYSLPEASKVTLKIYNITGQLVKTLVNDYKEAGNYKVIWDGRNNSGQKVAAGVYFYQIRTDKFTQTKKMVMLK